MYGKLFSNQVNWSTLTNENSGDITKQDKHGKESDSHMKRKGKKYTQ